MLQIYTFICTSLGLCLNKQAGWPVCAYLIYICLTGQPAVWLCVIYPLYVEGGNIIYLITLLPVLVMKRPLTGLSTRRP